jgi:hypothetical protein
VLNDDWQGVGRQRILDKTGFNAVAQDLQKHEGHSIKSINKINIDVKVDTLLLK